MFKKGISKDTELYTLNGNPTRCEKLGRNSILIDDESGIKVEVDLIPAVSLGCIKIYTHYGTMLACGPDQEVCKKSGPERAGNLEKEDKVRTRDGIVRLAGVEYIPFMFSVVLFYSPGSVFSGNSILICGTDK